MLQNICLLALILIEGCLGSNLKVFDFQSRSDSQLVIPVESSKTLNHGFTICFRMKLRNWNDTRIITCMDNLELIFFHYKYDAGGFISFGTTAKYFNALFDIKKFNSWQPFCLTYDILSYTSRLYVDGEKIMEAGNITNEIGEPFNLGNKIAFGSLNQYHLSGSLTDLNVWSR